MFLALGAGEEKVAFKHVDVCGKIKKCPECSHVETAVCYISDVTM